MVLVADSRLRRLGNQCLREQQCDVLQLSAKCEFALHDLAAEPIGVTWTLHFRAGRHALAAHENGDTDQEPCSSE